MYFPWIGLLEQIRLADTFVHYDDVQFSKGSFINRVQIKTAKGVRWLTIPLRQMRLGQRIDEVEVAAASTWQPRHLEAIQSAYVDAPYLHDALNLMERVFARSDTNLKSVARESMMALATYFGLTERARFLDSVSLPVTGRGSDRVLGLVNHLGGDVYITGHGARNYLDHEQFERAGIAVEYMCYECRQYPQLHGAFTPYVSALDLVANCGRDGVRYICSSTMPWREMMND